MSDSIDICGQEKSSKIIVPVIIVVDSSDGVAGDRIECINNAINNTIERFADFNRNEAIDVIIKIAVLRYSSGAQWVTRGLEDPDCVEHISITAGGACDLGSALDELNSKLSRDGFFAGPYIYADSFIYLICGGGHTDDLEAPLKKLKSNEMYRASTITAMAFFDGTDYYAIRNVVGDHNIVIFLSNGDYMEWQLGDIARLVIESLPDSVRTAPLGETPGASRYGSALCRPFCGDMATPDCTPACGRSAPHKMSARPIEPDSDIDLMDELSAYPPPAKASEKSSDTGSDGGSSGESAAKSAKSSTGDFSGWFKRGFGALVGSAFPKAHKKKPGSGSDSSNKSGNSGISAPEAKPKDEKLICESCASEVTEGHKFCPECGALIKKSASSAVSVSQVQFSAVVPKSFVKGEYAMIDIAVYEEEYRAIVDRVIANADNEVREVVAGSHEVAANTMIKIRLSSPDIDVSDCEETQKWQGRHLVFSFPVEIPGNFAKSQILFTATVYFNDLIATKLKFVAKCTSLKEQKLKLTREDVLTAFISYASQDRSRVAAIIQGMKKARPDMDIFFDVESLRSGEYWERALKKEIEDRDILFLCWSNFARKSEWVEKEWRYALANKGIDAIEPIPLVPPAECPPPDELKSKHFNDRALLYNEPSAVPSAE